MGNHSETKTIAVLCAKRGNPVYQARVRKRLGWIQRTVKDEDLEGDNTRVLFVSLTYDPSLKSLNEAWETVGEDFNRFITALRQKYGKISYLRSWEAHKNGYPHVHVVLIFHEYVFKTWKDFDEKEGRPIFRIFEKREFEPYWHSFLDIRAVKNLATVARYVEKRIIRGTEKDFLDPQHREEGDLTLALCWVFRKRSFSISGNFQETLSDLIRKLHNSNKFEDLQATLDGEILEVVWIFIGVFTLQELKIKPEKDPPWVVEVDPKLIS
jgi:hypothetical protein